MPERACITECVSAVCWNGLLVVHRRQTPKVKDGRVQKKNNWELSPHYSQVAGLGFVIDRERPGKGYRHLLRQSHIERFTALLPEWDDLSRGLDAIVLSSGESDVHGWHGNGVIGICAWPREIVESVNHAYVADHQRIIDQLDVPTRRFATMTRIEWTEDTARAFQLLHVLLHELGHHHDRITTRSQRRASRGESYAERYAYKYSERIWERYVAEFGVPSLG
jgi:hypothetical protein